MKKFLLGITAIVLAVGFSAFKPGEDKSKKQDLVTTYWFLVQSSIDLNDPISDADAVFLEMNAGTAPTDASCTSGGKYCIVGFTNSSQVNEFQPDEYEIVGTQVPAERPYTKN